ncbi:MAG: Stp1/IreP family PP2C-type Ser/Thr phosphatase [Myxococcota bacterium]
MSSPRQRPSPFPPGTHLSEHYKIEGLVRLSEGRMFYLANDDRPDRARRFCWECGSDDTPRSRTTCVSCEADLSPRRFLVSVRWEPARFEPFMKFFDRQLDHPGMNGPIDLFFEHEVLCAISPWRGEGLMLDESAPLPARQILDLAQRATGVIAFFHFSGVSLGDLTAANFLVGEGREYLFYDPEISAVHAQALPESRQIEEIKMLGALLQRFTSVDEQPLSDFFGRAAQGEFATPLAFGRALEKLIQRDYPSVLPNILAAMSDVGLARSLNEDNWGWSRLSPDTNLFVVADGMGGHEKGEVASQMAVNTICSEARGRLQHIADFASEVLENVLDESFQMANNSIKAHSEEMGNDMGTTLTAALIREHRLALIANVGDSRAYLMRDQQLHQVTRDHSLVARMVEQNRIRPEEARHHPHSNILLRTVGTERNVDIDIFRVDLQDDDLLLLCSDGLWGEVDDADIEAILNHYEDLRIGCRELVRAAHQGGGKDNVTVMIIQIPGPRSTTRNPH